MGTRAASVQAFLSQKKLAIVGASRSGQKFGNAIMNDLSARGYTLFPVHKEATMIGDRKCYPSLTELPEEVGGVIVVVKPEQTAQVVRDAHAAGIKRVWLQQGAQSDEAIAFCNENGMDVVSRECILMFAEPVESVHRFHRFFKRLFGKMPA